MNRIGFKVNMKSIEDIKTIKSMNNLILEGMFTHFSCADEKDKSYSKMQIKRYDEFVQMLLDKKICTYYRKSMYGSDDG